MTKSPFILALLFTLCLVSCKRTEIKKQEKENELVNSPNPALFLSGEYLATYVEWSGDYKGIEGQNWVDKPSTISGSYKLLLEKTPIGDSLRVYIDGSGRGPVFTKELIGTFAIFNKTQVGVIPGQVVYTKWDLKDKQIKNLYDYNLYASRAAKPNETLFTIEFSLSRVSAPKAGDFGRYIAYSADRFAELQGVGHFMFKRLSKGVVK